MDELDELQPAASDLVSLNELAKQFGVSEPTIRNYVTKGMPYVTRGNRDRGVQWEFSLSECLEWHSDQATTRRNAKQTDDEDAGIVAARIAKLNVETERLQLRLAKERGELVPIDRVAELVEGQMTTLRTHLLALPIKLAPILTGQTDTKNIEGLITSYIREALEELAEDRVMDGVKPEIDGDVVESPSAVTQHLNRLIGIENDDNG